MKRPLTYAAYVKHIGEPRVVPCNIDLWPHSGYIYMCFAHDYAYNERLKLLDGRMDDRCPVSRLEEWREKRWDLGYS